MTLATERLSVEAALTILPEARRRAAALLARIGPFAEIAPGARILDIGSAHGLLVAALRELGYDAIGVDPWQGAIDAANAIAARSDLETKVVAGDAQHLPFDDGEFDLVIALSVLEHVDDPLSSMREAARVLNANGCFYFYSTSAVCPRQAEIKRFPLFPWYPQPVKRRIMKWAVEKRPSLINHTTRPAYHWFTPWKVRQLATEAGFDARIDRWQLRSAVSRSGLGGALSSAIAHGPITRFLADLAVEDSAYLLLKDDSASNRS